jgi:hypothetical protein
MVIVEIALTHGNNGQRAGVINMSVAIVIELLLHSFIFILS